jgi:hypothetical protein
MKKIRYIISTIILSVCSISYTSALSAFTFSKKFFKWQSDVPANPDDWTWIDWDYSILDIINLVNSYLRFWVWFVCFLFTIINGYKLITANWDEKKSKAAITWLIWSIIWIVVCILAYIIVNVTVKLFD